MSKNDLNICLDMISHFVRIYKCHDKRPRDIYTESKYEQLYQDVSIEKIVKIIKNDESIVKEWILFTLDKRWTPAWGLFERENGKWGVSLIQNTGKPSYEIIYEDRILACAHMIKFEMEDLRLSNTK